MPFFFHANKVFVFVRLEKKSICTRRLIYNLLFLYWCACCTDPFVLDFLEENTNMICYA